MKRKDFLKKTIATGVAGTVAGGLMHAKSEKENTIGYNHLPNKEIKTMNTVLHKANTRGTANHGWLEAKHSFSFANYHNPDRMNFGVLRVLNDDRIAAAKGFGMHPHDNMEIITIPLDGDLEHRDSMGNGAVIRHGDVQVMSAGTGIRHSEFNANEDAEVKLLQIWLFPKTRNVEPRYDQISISDLKTSNAFYQILSPNVDDDGVWIHQNAWFHLGDFDQSTTLTYDLKDNENGVYAFIIEGTANIEGQDLEKRDGFGVWDTEKIEIKASADSKVLLMEVPMRI